MLDNATGGGAGISSVPRPPDIAICGLVWDVDGRIGYYYLALAAAAVAFTIYAVGLIASFRLPEPTAENLPD